MAEPLWTAEEAGQATGGALSGGEWTAAGVSIDTRTLQPGDLFVALKDQRDGHDFVANAFEKGAAAALVERPIEAGPELVAPDALKALEALGAAGRDRCSGIRIGVTGSVGKTGVKEALKRIFDAAGRGHASERSYNNHWGVPLTLARMPVETERAVFEMGMNHAGELTALSAQVRPHIAAITRIGEAHIGNLGSIEAIADAKAEIFSGLVEAGVAVINADDPYAPQLEAQTYGRRIVRFGHSARADVRVLNYTTSHEGGAGRFNVMGETVSVSIAASGDHWAENLACALACAALAGVAPEVAASALHGFGAPEGRGGVERILLDVGEAVLIDDSYNANPVSMRSALASLGAREPAREGRRIAVLGDMLELGADAARYHADLAAPIDDAGVDLVFVSGELMGALWDRLPESRRWAQLAPGAEAAVTLISGLRDGDVILIKGSNASGMSRLAAALKGGG